MPQRFNLFPFPCTSLQVYLMLLPQIHLGFRDGKDFDRAPSYASQSIAFTEGYRTAAGAQ